MAVVDGAESSLHVDFSVIGRVGAGVSRNVPVVDDLKYAIRSVRRSAAYSVLSVVALAGAIGINAAVHGVMDAVVFRPLPYHASDRLYVVHMVDDAGNSSVSVPHQLLEALVEATEHTMQVAWIDPLGDMSFEHGGTRSTIACVGVSANFFRVLGSTAAIGRVFEPSDDANAASPVLLSHGAWRRRFADTDGPVGQVIAIGPRSHDVVGILPAGFVWPVFLSQSPEAVTLIDIHDRSTSSALVVIRLPDHMSVTEAQARVDAASRGSSVKAPRPRLHKAGPLLYPVGRAVMTPIFAATLLVLLLGCANLSVLAGARARVREREHAMRAALGATRARILRPVVMESVLLGFVGAAVALGTVLLTFGQLMRHIPPAVIRDAPVGIGPRVAVATLLLGIVSGVGVSMLPAWRASGVNPLSAMRDGPSGLVVARRGFGRALLVVQVAVAVALAAPALGAVIEFTSLVRMPLGFDPEGVLRVRVRPSQMRGLEAQTFYARLVDELAARPDIVAAGAVGSMPLTGVVPDEGLVAPDGHRLPVGIVHMLPGYFEAAGIELVRGRLPQARDLSAMPGASVVSESAARVLFPGADALGGTFRGASGRQFEIVGVVRDVVTMLGQPPRPLGYVFPGEVTQTMTIVARALTRDAAVLGSVERHARPLAQGAAVSAEWWTDGIRALGGVRNPRFRATVLGALALVAIGLAISGVFSIVTSVCTSRRHEFAVRLAVGALPRSLVRTAIAALLPPVAAGTLLGLAAGALVDRVLASLVPGAGSWNPDLLTPAAAIVVATALAAAALAALRGTKLNPADILRAE